MNEDDLFAHLKQQACKSIAVYLDTSEGEDYDYDQQYEYWTEWFLEDEESDEWWYDDENEFKMDDLGIDAFNELLQVNLKFMGEYGGDNIPESVTELMRRYAYYHIHEGLMDDIWKQEWNYKFPPQV